MWKKNLIGDKLAYFWILISGLLFRFFWAISVPVKPVSDSHAYDTFAQNLANCQNYGWTCDEPSAYWPVGTSFIYSLLYRLFGHHYLPIVIIHILIALVTIALTMYLAEMWFDRQIAVMSGVFLAIWPSQVQMVTILNSELIFTAVVVIALSVWLTERWNLFIRAGVTGSLLAAACYVRPTALLIPALLLFIRYVSTRQIVQTLKATAIMLVVMGLLIAPWSLRNYGEFGEFVVISTNGGANLWMGNNPESTGGYMPLPPEVDGMTEVQRNTYLKNQAKDYIKENPLLFIKNSTKRVIVTHSRESIGIVWNEEGIVSRYGERVLMPLKLLSSFYWIVMLTAAILGIVLLFARYGVLATIAQPTVLFWLYYAAIHGVIVAQDRYHFPSIPMIAVLASFFLCSQYQRYAPTSSLRTWRLRL